MANSHNLKIQDGGERHVRFRKMSITPNWTDVFAPNLVGRCISRPCGNETRPNVKTGS